jgi:hypothetical protein
MSLKDIFKYKTITGLEIFIKPGGDFLFHITELKKTGSKLQVVRTVETIEGFDKLKEAVDKKTALCISVNGKGIIHKKTDLNGLTNPEHIINKVLPGGNTREFCYQVTATGSEQHFISLVRKEIISEIFRELKKNGFINVQSCFLGPFALNSILSEINETSLCFSGQQLAITDNLISDIQPTFSSISEDGILVAEENVRVVSLNSFATAYAYFADTESNIQSDLIDEIVAEAKAKRNFELRKFSTIVSTFLILVVNFFIFSSYVDRNNDLSQAYQVKESATLEYEVLKKEYELKKTFLEENDLSRPSRTSFFANSIAGSLPSSINLNTLIINPVKAGKNTDENKLFFENRTIDLSGKCEQGNDLNQWMKQIKKYNWVSDVTLINYSQDRKNEAGLFLLRIKIRNS